MRKNCERNEFEKFSGIWILKTHTNPRGIHVNNVKLWDIEITRERKFRTIPTKVYERLDGEKNRWHYTFLLPLYMERHTHWNLLYTIQLLLYEVSDLAER